ncbi:MAG: EamA family transporter [Rhodobacteraceae bacterium]|nr:EamA family transporter [Paracoccaceae bacterium]
MTPAKERWKGHLAMLGFSLGIAGSFSLGSQVANLISPVAITAARFMFTAILLGTVLLLLRKVKRSHLEASWRYAVAGALMAVYFVLMFVALRTTSAVSTSAVFTLTPLMSGAFAWLLLRQTMTRRMAVALCTGAAGAIWVIFDADVGALLSFRVGSGELTFFVGCVAHAFYTPFLRRANRGEPPVVFVFGMVVTGTVILLIYGWRDVSGTQWLELPSLVWITIAYVTMIATLLTFVAVNYASLRLPSAKVMAYTYLTPSWVILWEFAFGNALPSMPILAGILVTIVALVMLLGADGE